MTLSRRNIVIFGVVALLLVTVYFLLDPMKTPWMPKCMLHVITGLDCPGCGSQRAAHALLHGDVAGAFSANALLVVMIPYILLILYAELFRERHQKLFKAIYSRTAVIIVVSVVMVWGIIRNLL